jgi:hypothetical protein
MFSPERRRRRYGWWLLLLAAGFVVLALLTGGIRTDNRQLTEFFDESRTLAMDSDQISADFRSLIRAELATTSREDFEILMERLEGLMTDNSAALKQVTRPDSAFASGELLSLAFDSWGTGLADFHGAVIEVTDDPAGHSPVDQLAAAIVQLRVGDLLYARFLDSANDLKLGLDVAIGDFPVVAFVTTEPALLNGDLLSRTIRGSTEMGVRQDLSILQVVFDPIPTGGEGDDGELIFPATGSMAFSVVISNQGNVDEKAVLVSMTFQSEEGAVLANADSALLDLAPNDTNSVTFPVVEVLPGSEYTLVFTVTLANNDLTPDNNSWDAQLRINSPG